MTENTEASHALVAGKYRLSRLLGRGGMGSVWEGVHISLGNRVAVKFIDAEHAESPEARSRFENEARAAAKLRSKYVVEVYDHGVGDDGRPFIVMEYLEGEPLDRRLDRVGRLSARDTALILHQVCRALGKAHAGGIVHRDLKPENVFLVWDDEDGADVAKVVDFGIAKLTNASVSPSSATRTGSILGTPYYMSPEQARGLRSVDFRTDIWSLGVIAYRCIVGVLPFEGEALGDLLVKLCTEPIPVPSAMFAGVPPGFDAFVQRALEREPERRFQSVRDFSDSLSAICGLTTRGPYPMGEAPQNAGWGADGSGPYPVLAPAVSSAPVPMAVLTGAPLTQTPAPGTPAPRKRSALVAAGLSILVVCAIAAGVMANKLISTGDSDTVVAAPSAQLTQRPVVEHQVVGERQPSTAPSDRVAAPETPSPPTPPEPVPSAAAPAMAAPPAAKSAVLPRAVARPVRRAEPPSAKKPVAKPDIDIGY